MMYSQIIKLNSTGPAYGDTPELAALNSAGFKTVKFLVRKTEGEIEVGDDILITDEIAIDAQDPEVKFYLNDYDFISMDIAGDISNFSVECTDCDLLIDEVTIEDNRSFTVLFSGNAYLTHPLITPDDVPAVAAEDPVIVITSDTAFDSIVAVETLANWTITPGTTGLVLNSALWVDDHTANLSFTGTVVGGHLIIQADQECYAGDLRSLSIDLNTTAETYATETVPVGEITLTVDSGCVLGASADLTMTYSMGGAVSTVSFADTGMTGTLDIYLHNDEAFYHVDEITVDEDANYLGVANPDLKPASPYSFKYTSTIVGDTANYFLKAIYE